MRRRLVKRCQCLLWMRGDTGSLATDDTDFCTDIDRFAVGHGPRCGCSLGHRGEEWVWDVDFAYVKGLVHAGERCDDGSFLPHLGYA